MTFWPRINDYISIKLNVTSFMMSHVALNVFYNAVEII